MYEILVVDDGSTDSTSAIVEQYTCKYNNVQLVKLPYNHGKGYAVKVGMLKAKNNLRLFADADGATPIEEIERLKKVIDRGCDVAIGSRALRNEECLIQGRLHRKILLL